MLILHNSLQKVKEDEILLNSFYNPSSTNDKLIPKPDKDIINRRKVQANIPVWIDIKIFKLQVNHIQQHKGEFHSITKCFLKECKVFFIFEYQCNSPPQQNKDNHMINLIDVERHLLNCKLIYNNDSLEIKNREFSQW